MELSLWMNKPQLSSSHQSGFLFSFKKLKKKIENKVLTCLNFKQPNFYLFKKKM
jgi:hypothetical protein